MLEVRNVRKAYTTGDFTQVALDDVNVSFRDNEFVAILGPSGSGKTTLLNIVGGLDRYDSGALIIDGINTSEYKDRDWDAYRNNRVGFVFQSYNLIPHQTVLANVEMALTLSGVSRKERQQRALKALAQVGLRHHAGKRPSQLSGGQMQRVAIARALINDPEIVLADEPTGALDSQTSTQIMDLLSKIAEDRLVVMVTHNPELADEYANRVVTLKDGQVSTDSNPLRTQEATVAAEPKETRKTSMSFFTAISLSFSNLMTKKGRTLMTAFAGSIGIIGIAAILALANGINNYIKSIEEDTLSVYPLSIRSQGLDLLSLVAGDIEYDSDEEAPEGEIREIGMVSRLFDSVGSNDLAALKVFLDDNGGNIDDYANSIQYSYNVTPQIFTETPAGKNRQVNPDTTFAAMGLGANSSNSLMSQAMSTSVFFQLPSDTRIVEAQYDLLQGQWPTSADEIVVVLTPGGAITDFMLYALGLRDGAELDAMVRQMVNEEQIDTPANIEAVDYDQVMGASLKVVDAAQFYSHDSKYGVWTDKRGDQAFVDSLIKDGMDLKVSGIVQAKGSATATALSPGIYYTPDLVNHLIEESGQTPIVKQQLAKPGVNVFTGRTFAEEESESSGPSMDFSQMISIDQDALKNAFTIDESQLALDTSALEFSMPGIQIDQSAMPALDLQSVMGSVAVPPLDMEAVIAQLVAEQPTISPDIQIDEEKTRELVNQMMRGYSEYCTTVASPQECVADAEGTFNSFLETPEGQVLSKQVDEMAAEAAAELAQSLQAQQTEFAEKLAQAIAGAAQQQMQATSAAMATALQNAIANYMDQAMTAVSGQIGAQIGSALESQLASAMETVTNQLANNMSSAMGIDEAAFKDAFKFNLTDEEMSELVMTMMSAEQTSFDGNLSKLGYADLAKPASIDIFPKNFEGKGQIIQILDDYNAEMEANGDEAKVITYTDIVGTLMSSVTTIVNVVSYVLVAFVSISLVVSSVMIGVITYISVLERKKEIGILRAMGASKRDIRRVFNAETMIVGMVAGLIGVGITYLLTIPVNAIVYSKFDIAGVAQLPVGSAAILVLISTGLTLLAGLIPSSAASRRDPVEALRSE